MAVSKSYVVSRSSPSKIGVPLSSTLWHITEWNSVCGLSSQEWCHQSIQRLNWITEKGPDFERMKNVAFSFHWVCISGILQTISSMFRGVDWWTSWSACYLTYIHGSVLFGSESPVHSFLYTLSLIPPGFHHDSVPEALLEGWALVIHQQHKQEHDIWWSPGEEDLGPWCLLCPLQEVLHPRHHHRQHHATCLSWWTCSLQLEVCSISASDLLTCF